MLRLQWDGHSGRLTGLHQRAGTYVRRTGGDYGRRGCSYCQSVELVRVAGFVGEIALRHAGPLVLWQPALVSLDRGVPLLSAICAVRLLYRHRGIPRVLSVAAVGGVSLSMVTN